MILSLKKIQEAKKLIETNGTCRGRFAERNGTHCAIDDADAKCQFCILGALLFVTGTKFGRRLLLWNEIEKVTKLERVERLAVIHDQGKIKMAFNILERAYAAAA